MPFTDSDPATGSLALLGVWIHDPSSPQGTVKQFLYGRAARSAAIDVTAQVLLFAGRTYPVVEYGEHQDDTFTVRIDVPNGATWATQLAALQAFAEARRTLYVRDNRGRAMHAHLDGYTETDQEWGTQVTLRAIRVDHTVEL